MTGRIVSAMISFILVLSCVPVSTSAGTHEDAVYLRTAENKGSKRENTGAMPVRAGAYPLSDIRSIYVETDGTPVTKDQKVDAAITVFDKEGGDSFEDDNFYSPVYETGTIKVRGNSTSAADKKPYNISFSSPQNLFGMGAAKKWSLLANAFDKSLVRNRLAMELGSALGLLYTSQSTFADLFINGVYQGNYLLIESVEAGKDRVDIDPLNGSDILLEKEYDRLEEGQSYIRTARYGIRFVTGDPEGLAPDSDHYKKTVSFLNRFERLLEDGDYESLRAVTDLESFADFYIVNELFKTVDFNYSSTRFYIKDGKLYAGPLWDLDLSAGNASPEMYATYYENGITYTGLWCRQFMWFEKLMQIPEFYNRVSERYEEIQPVITDMISGNGKFSINAITDAYAASFARNYTEISAGGAGWSVTEPDSADGYSAAASMRWASYGDAVEYLRRWLYCRNNYLLSQFTGGMNEEKRPALQVTVNESADDIILNGNADGSQSMKGDYAWDNVNYQYLGYATFKGQATSDYKYLVLRYTGDISSLRLEFVANAGKEDEYFSDIYWFKDVTGGDRKFVSADGREFALFEREAEAVIDLWRSGIDAGVYSSGAHMHCALDMNPTGSFQITDARLVKSVTISQKGEEETVPEEETTAPSGGQNPGEEVTTPSAEGETLPSGNNGHSEKNEPEEDNHSEKQNDIANNGHKNAVKKPARTRIKSAIRKKNKAKAKITLKKVRRADGYQIKASTGKKFRKKAAVVKYCRRPVAILRGLRKKRSYYVKARAYMVFQGKKYYGKWSASIKIRKG